MEQLEELIHSLYSKMNIKCFPFMDYGTKVTVKAYGPLVNNISCFTVPQNPMLPWPHLIAEIM